MGLFGKQKGNLNEIFTPGLGFSPKNDFKIFAEMRQPHYLAGVMYVRTENTVRTIS